MLIVFVCMESTRHLKEAYNTINQLQQIIEEKQLEEKIEVKAALCPGQCGDGVSVRFDEEEFKLLSNKDVRNFVEEVVMEKLYQRVCDRQRF